MTRLSLPAAIAAALCLLCLPPVAGAAVIEHTASSGTAAEDFLVYKGGKGEKNRLTVITAKKSITFVDRGARIRRKRGDFKGCKVRSRHRAVCKVEPFTTMDISLGDRNDRVRFRGKYVRTKYGAAPRTRPSNPSAFEDTYPEDEGQVPFNIRIAGGKGDDVLNGTGGGDVIVPGAGRNLVDGGAGPDTIFAAPTDRPDRLRGGRGLDALEITARGSVAVDMTQETVTRGTAVDRLNSLEKVYGGGGNDTLKGGEAPDGLFGGGGNDKVEGLGGGDYVSGDLDSTGAPRRPGVDVLDGGGAGDVVDARDGESASGTPTDQMLCGEGVDTIIARVDDLADPSCERSAFGEFTGALEDFGHQLVFDSYAGVQPVARAANGAPTYSIRCPNTGEETARCTGRVELRRPPTTASGDPTELLGYGEFSFGLNQQQNIPVTLNPAGRALLAQPSALVSVRVVMGVHANPRPPGSTQQPTPGPDADFGWQQRLSRP
jgi:hypothetical protein